MVAANFDLSSIVCDSLLKKYYLYIVDYVKFLSWFTRNTEREASRVSLNHLCFERECMARILHRMNLRQSDPSFSSIAQWFNFCETSREIKIDQWQKRKGETPIARCRAIDHRKRVVIRNQEKRGHWMRLQIGRKSLAQNTYWTHTTKHALLTFVNCENFSHIQRFLRTPLPNYS